MLNFSLLLLKLLCQLDRSGLLAKGAVLPKRKNHTLGRMCDTWCFPHYCPRESGGEQRAGSEMMDGQRVFQEMVLICQVLGYNQWLY